MPKANANTNRHPSPFLRRLVLLICCSAAVGGLGCATWLATSRSNPNAYNHYNKPILTDSIFALGRPNEAMARKIGNTNAIAFLGKQHTYLLVEGGTQLNNITRELEGVALTLGDARGQLFLKQKTVWGRVSLHFTPEKGITPPGVTTNKLLAMGFKADRRGAYSLTVPVKGVVCPPAKLDKPLLNELSTVRTVAFFNPPDSSPPPDLEKFIIVPLAVVLDLALTPVYLLGFLSFAIGGG